MGGHLPASGDVQSAGGAGGWPAEAASLSPPQPQAVGGPTVLQYKGVARVQSMQCNISGKLVG